MANLIDRDVLLHFLGECIETSGIPANMEKAYQNARDYVRSMKTVDAEPVRHGRWIDVPNPYVGTAMQCSECGHQDNLKTAIKGRYCWYCGAKMDDMRA